MHICVELHPSKLGMSQANYSTDLRVNNMIALEKYNAVQKNFGVEERNAIDIERA